MALAACSQETPDVEEPATETPVPALPTLEVTSTVAQSYPAPATVVVQSYPDPPTTVAIDTPVPNTAPATTVAIETPESAVLSTATIEIAETAVPTEITVDTPESAATATVEGDNLEIEETQPTTIAVEEPQPTPEPIAEATAAPQPEQTFPAACELAPEPRLATLLQSRTALAEILGCPIAEPEQTWAAWELFEEDNQMVWLENQDLIFAIYDDFWHGYEDTFEEGEPEVPPGAPLPSKAGHMIPIRGFGKVWIQISEEMGFAVSEEAGYNATLQGFENGWLVTTPYGQVLALLGLTDNPQSQGAVQSWLERDGEWVGEE